MSDPVEQIIADALDYCHVEYVREREPERLDFYLPRWKLHIEVKQFHSDRIAEQMSRAPNVIAVQGIEAARWLAAAIKDDPQAEWWRE